MSMSRSASDMQDGWTDFTRMIAPLGYPQSIHRWRGDICSTAVMAKSDLTPTLIRLPKDLHDAATARAANDDRSLAQLVRVALREYLATDAVPPVPHAHV